MKIEKLRDQVKNKLENDTAHDFEHVMRVLKNATMIAKKEKADIRMITAAVLLHDIISYPKSDPRSKNSSFESAEESKKIIEGQ